MTKDTRAKPSAGASPGASRAAHLLRDIVAREGRLPFPRHLALIIDRETGVAELLEAAKETLVGAEGSDYSMVNATLKLTRLRNAIAKCEGGEED
jgi:hypothetical protein